MILENLNELELGRITKLNQLSGESIIDSFDWPDSLSDDVYWMPEELLSTFGTDFHEKLSDEKKIELSKVELLRFFSENVHGEIYLLRQLLQKYSEGYFNNTSEFIHHFMKEEGEHIQVFSEFCRRYGELYTDKRIDLGGADEPIVESLLFFCRVLIFENHVDFINQKIATAKNIPSIINDLNRYHCEDEARHVAFGMLMVKNHYQQLLDNHSAEVVEEVNLYIEQYILSTLELFYSSKTYEEVGFDNPEATRIDIMSSTGRSEFHKIWLKRSCKVFYQLGVFNGRSVDQILHEYFNRQTKEAHEDGFKMVVNWVEEQNLTGEAVDPDVNLFSAKIISSLKFMQLLMIIQEASGAEVVLAEIDLDALTTLNQIKKSYFS